MERRESKRGRPEDETPEGPKEAYQTPEEIIGDIMAEEDRLRMKEVKEFELELERLKRQAAILEEKLKEKKKKDQQKNSGL